MHVAARLHRHRRGRRAEPHRVGPGVVEAVGVDLGGSGERELPEPALGALVEAAVADHDVGHAGRDRHRRLLDGRAGRTAAVVDPAEEPHLLHAQLAGHRDLGGGVHGERRQPVDVVDAQPAVGQRGADRLDRELELGAAGRLGELGGADADDRGLARDRHWATTFTVPVDVVTERDPADDVDRRDPVRHGGDGPAEGERVVGVRGGAEADRDALELGVRAGPVDDEPLDQPVGGQDVHEDVLGPGRLRDVAVVVDVLPVAGRDRGAHDRGRRHRQAPLGDDLAGLEGPHCLLDARSAASGRRRSRGSPPAAASRSRSRRLRRRPPRPPSARPRRGRSARSRSAAPCRGPAGAGARRTRTPCRCRRPRRSRGRRPSQLWQAGPGGNRFAPQALHFWIRSSPALVPSQKNCESRLTIGRTVMSCPWG